MIQSVIEDEQPNIFEARKAKIHEICQRKKAQNEGPFINDPSKLFVLKDRAITWCPVFKAGSSTWLSAILEMSSKSETEKILIKRQYPKNYLKHGRIVAPALTRSSHQNYLKNLKKFNQSEISFIVVRHPFERLVSAYRDKLERSHAKNYLTDFYYKTYGRKIVQKYRQKALKKFGDDFFR